MRPLVTLYQSNFRSLRRENLHSIAIDSSVHLHVSHNLNGPGNAHL